MKYGRGYFIWNLTTTKKFFCSKSVRSFTTSASFTKIKSDVHVFWHSVGGRKLEEVARLGSSSSSSSSSSSDSESAPKGDDEGVSERSESDEDETGDKEENEGSENSEAGNTSDIEEGDEGSQEGNEESEEDQGDQDGNDSEDGEEREEPSSDDSLVGSETESEGPARNEPMTLVWLLSWPLASLPSLRLSLLCNLANFMQDKFFDELTFDDLNILKATPQQASRNKKPFKLSAEELPDIGKPRNL